MNYNQILQYIVLWIKENHNNEITGDILQDVLVQIVQYVKEGSDNVDVDIQELQNQIDAISLAQEVNVFEGNEDPNVVPPTETFAAADVFVKTNTNDVFIFTGASWFNITQAGGGGGTDFTTDQSLYLDPFTKELRINVGQTTQTFEWQSGAQEFALTDEPVIINYIAVNGQLLANPLTQWSVDVPNKKITILDTLEPDDIININYKFIITK